jgi:hypothetical protein
MANRIARFAIFSYPGVRLQAEYFVAFIYRSLAAIGRIPGPGSSNDKVQWPKTLSHALQPAITRCTFVW